MNSGCIQICAANNKKWSRKMWTRMVQSSGIPPKRSWFIWELNIRSNSSERSFYVCFAWYCFVASSTTHSVCPCVLWTFRLMGAVVWGVVVWKISWKFQYEPCIFLVGRHLTESMAKDYDYLLKVLLVGDSDVGKNEIMAGLEDGSSESPFCSGGGNCKISEKNSRWQIGIMLNRSIHLFNTKLIKPRPYCWMENAWSCRYGTHLARVVSAPSYVHIREALRASFWCTISPTSGASMDSAVG